MWQYVNYLASTYEQFRPLVDEILNIIEISIGDYDLVYILLQSRFHFQTSPFSRQFSSYQDNLDKAQSIGKV